MVIEEFDDTLYNEALSVMKNNRGHFHDPKVGYAILSDKQEILYLDYQYIKVLKPVDNIIKLNNIIVPKNNEYLVEVIYDMNLGKTIIKADIELNDKVNQEIIAEFDINAKDC